MLINMEYIALHPIYPKTVRINIIIKLTYLDMIEGYNHACLDKNMYCMCHAVILMDMPWL